MSVVRINVLEVPEGGGDELAERFRARAGEVEKMPGFEGFELLRPADGSNRWYVYTRWADEASFEAWVGGQAFQRGHAQAADAAKPPVAKGSSVLAFDVVLRAGPAE